MDETPNPQKNDHIDHDHESVEMLDYVITLLKWRKFIVINVFAVTIIAAIISLFLPKWYKATSSILPPKEQNMLSSIGSAGSLLKNFSSLRNFGTPGQNLGAYNYLAILKSRSAMESVVDRFNLTGVYDIGDSSREKAIKVLRENVSFEIQDEDYITIEVLDKSPQRAADMANYFVEILNDISIQLGTQEAKINREFIEKRLEKSQGDLRNAEDSLRQYQEKSGMMIAPEQNMASISSIAELYGMKAKREVEIAILERTVTQDNSALKRLRLELSELKKKIATFPQTTVESFRLYRDVAIQQKIVEFLVPLYEQAKIDEQKDIPVILVLDKAVPPEKKEKPRRLLIVLFTAILTFAFSVMVVIFVEGWKKFKTIQPTKYRKFQSVIGTIRIPRVFSQHE